MLDKTEIQDHFDYLHPHHLGHLGPSDMPRPLILGLLCASRWPSEFLCCRGLGISALSALLHLSRSRRDTNYSF
jgi:hypothetical protein